MKKTPLYSLLLLIISSYSQSETTRFGPDYVGEPVTPAIVTVNLKSFSAPRAWQPGDPIKEIPMQYNRPKDWQRPAPADRGYGFDPLAQKQLDLPQSFAPSAFNTPIVNVDGLGYTGVNPSDTNGDVGLDYYIQSINNGSSSGILIVNKSDGTIASQFLLNAIAAGSGTGCGGGDGDPVIMFDQLADNAAGQPKGRWVLTEFTPTSFCVYISKTADPIGSTSSTWFIYEFGSDSGNRPDYPKFGVWNDAYYIGANESNRQYALDRINMLAGQTARGYQVFQTVGLPGFGFQHMMPADADGNIPPPAGAPGIFMRHRDSEYHGDPGGDDVLEIWEFTTDFDTPANSSITGPINIVVSEFDTNLGGTNFGDLSVPQPDGATNLFPLKQPLMWRVQHRTIDTKQYLVGNMVTDVDGNDYHGVRWWQLERPAATTNGGWTLKDEGTYTLNDGVHRWMASAAMDGDGNIAIGYNTSSSSVYAGMRYAGRLKDDPAGTLPRGETSIIEGSASNGSGRYGDYTSLSVDPVDECTFWYTAQYNPTSNWNTRIASFKFEQCGCLLALNPINVTSVTNAAANDVQISWDDSSEPTMTIYKVYRTTTAGTGYIEIGTVADTSPGVGGSGTYTYNDNTVSAGTTYYYIIRSSDGVSCLTPTSNEVSVTATGVCTLAPTFSGIENASNPAIAQCTNDLSWSSGASQCPNGAGTLNYSVYRSTSSVFTPNTGNQIATGLTALSYNDMDSSLVSGTEYFYIVRAEDLDNNLEDDNTVTYSSIPTGPIVPSAFNEDLEGYADIASAEAGGWIRIQDAGAEVWDLQFGDDHTTGTGNAFVSTDVPTATDKSIATKEFVPTATSVLSFFHKFDFENNWDGGRLEITTDGGANWIDLGADITSGAYNGALSNGSGAPAWTGNLATFTEVTVDLSAYASQLVQVRWRSTTDTSVGAGDWKVDDIDISNIGAFGVCTSIAPASISVTKTAILTTDTGNPGEADENDVITFSVSIENTGGVALDNLVVNDTMAGVLTCAPTSLAAGSTATCTDYTYTVVLADINAGGTIDNTASATMTNLVDNLTYNASASTSTTINQALFKDGFE